MLLVGLHFCSWFSRNDQDGDGFAIVGSNDTAQVLFNREKSPPAEAWLQCKQESHLLHHTDTKPGEIPIRVMMFLWISNSEAEQK